MAASPPSLDAPPIDQTDLALLQAIGHGGTLAGVVRASGLTQASATRRLTRLQDRFGTLTTTNGDRMNLTARGRAIVEAAQLLVTALADGLRQITGESGGTRRIPQLRLAVFGSAWDAFADDLTANAPGLLLALRTAGPGRAVELFDRRIVDAAYVWQTTCTQVPPSRSARVLPVLDEPLWICLPADHRCAGRETVPLADLAADDWVVSRAEKSSDLLLGICAEAGFRPRMAHGADSAAMARSLVGHGAGVALASPLSAPPAAGSHLSFRPLAGPPRRSHRLIVDPGVVSERLAHLLRTRLRLSYRSKARHRNPRYVRMPDFPITEPPSCGPAVPCTDWTGLPPSTPGDWLEIDLEDLHLLKVIGRIGSVNRAARILSVSQPALSRRIQRLERRLGITLLVRGSRGTHPTSAAYQLLAVAAEAEAVLKAVIGNGT